jgi:hypothetical protein
MNKIYREKNLNSLFSTQNLKTPVFNNLPSANAGTKANVIFNSANSLFYGSTGANWVPLSGGGGGGSNGDIWTPYTVGQNPIYKSSYSTIQSAVNAAIADGASAVNPKLVLITPGVYNEIVTLSDGVNLLGADTEVPTLPSFVGDIVNILTVSVQGIVIPPQLGPSPPFNSVNKISRIKVLNDGINNTSNGILLLDNVYIVSSGVAINTDQSATIGNYVVISFQLLPPVPPMPPMPPSPILTSVDVINDGFLSLTNSSIVNLNLTNSDSNLINCLISDNNSSSGDANIILDNSSLNITNNFNNFNVNDVILNALNSNVTLNNYVGSLNIEFNSDTSSSQSYNLILINNNSQNFTLTTNQTGTDEIIGSFYNCNLNQSNPIELNNRVNVFNNCNFINGVSFRLTFGTNLYEKCVFNNGATIDAQNSNNDFDNCTFKNGFTSISLQNQSNNFNNCIFNQLQLTTISTGDHTFNKCTIGNNSNLNLQNNTNKFDFCDFGSNCTLQTTNTGNDYSFYNCNFGISPTINLDNTINRFDNCSFRNLTSTITSNNTQTEFNYCTFESSNSNNNLLSCNNSTFLCHCNVNYNSPFPPQALIQFVGSFPYALYNNRIVHNCNFIVEGDGSNSYSTGGNIVNGNNAVSNIGQISVIPV